MKKQTIRSIPKRKPYGKPVNLLKRTSSPLPGNWINSTNTLTGLRHSRKPLAGNLIKTNNHSKFDMKKGCITTRFLPSLQYTQICVVVPILSSSSYFMLYISLYFFFMYFNSLFNCILMQFTSAEVYCKLLLR